MSEAARRRWVMVASAVMLLVLIFVLRVVLTVRYGYLGESWEGSGTPDTGLSASFRIEGDAVAPISPGVTVPLALKFTNPHPYPMRVSHLTVRIGRVRAPDADRRHPCTVQDYVLVQVRSTVAIDVPPSSTVTLADLDLPRKSWPQVGMPYRTTNQDGCRGAKVTLAYAAFGSLDRS